MGEDTSLAIFSNNGWMFIHPGTGWSVYVLALDAALVFDNANWVAQTAQTPSMLGINATADVFNRLTVAAQGTLLNHDGAGHRLSVNKGAATDTASLLFQTGFSGRAEMGTTGTDDFAVKVSEDGAIWHEALVVDAATAVPSYPELPCFTATLDGGWRTISSMHEDLPFNITTLNQGNHFDPLTGGFTAPVAGVYTFVVNSFLDGATNANVGFGVDGVTQADQMQALRGNVPLSFTAMLNLVAGQVVTFRTATNNVVFNYFSPRTTFSGWKVA